MNLNRKHAQEVICMIKKILVPLDGSKLAEQILPQVEEMAKGLQAEVILITIGSLLWAVPASESGLRSAEEDRG
jgi:nucleotide-binding universal stress UspA family protein